MQREFGTIGGAPASQDIFDDRDQAHLGKGIGWAQLVASQRILQIAESGAGKTHEAIDWIYIVQLDESTGTW